MPDTSNPTIVIALLIAAYLVGSVPFAVVVSRIFGLADPRSYGSGNPGATNVLRSGNKAAAALTLVGDAAKGWLAVWLAVRIGASPLVVALVALAVFLGHLYPLFLGFKGGKGVATALGVLLAIQPWLGVATALTWLIIAAFMRYSSLAAIIAAVFAPCFYLLGGVLVWQTQPPIALAIVAIALTLVYRHRANVGRLLNGTEPRIGKKKA